MNDVDVNRANVIRLNEGGGKGKRSKTRGASNEEDQRNMFMEMCDPAMVREAIIEHIQYKRHLHLLHQRAEENDVEARQNLARLQRRSLRDLQKETNAPAQKHNYINLKVVKKVLQDFSSKNSRDLLSRQLAHAGIDVDEEERHKKALKMVETASSKYKVQQHTMKLENFGKKEENREGRMFKLRTFFLLTGGNLGKSWKSYIEDNVKAEIIRKKKILQEENERKIQESMRTQQERANLQKKLAYQAKSNNVTYGGGGDGGSLTGSVDSGGRRSESAGRQRNSAGRKRSAERKRSAGSSRHSESTPALTSNRTPETSRPSTGDEYLVRRSSNAQSAPFLTQTTGGTGQQNDHNSDVNLTNQNLIGINRK